MRCPTPETITKDKISNTVPCGKCVFCLGNRRTEWAFRLNEELKVAITGHFLTLTYADEYVPVTEDGELTLSKKDIRDYLKRLRWNIYQDWMNTLTTDEIILNWPLKRPQIKYYLTGEYGPETHRPHYHAIIFNTPQDIMRNMANIWQKGNIKIGTVTPKSINYVTKYLISDQEDTTTKQKPFSFMSNKIGENYLTSNHKMIKNLKQDYAINSNGQKTRLPRYYKDKIFNIKEREAIREKKIELSDKEYWKEYARIHKLGDDPFKYHQEQLKQNVARLKKNATKNNTL